ncbi:hypothetical protein [Hymenobacter properus]|uniref:Uncharacterized protein n=1 Tax=Hymenobacter properus TaxID=2791026 RepID=A0A931FN24_9BACT|nr:hypothetical protein [Hymenobacter properus]MBF9142214.1 hypothetical protein [Hymenobacter properus]MBR7721021.1 hypothetical protein [Microvirga sp. SRT04]
MRVALRIRLLLGLLVLLLAMVPVAFGVYINETSPAPTTARLANRCSRYCEAHACPHATRANSTAYLRLRPLYNATVRGLMGGGRQWYAEANILFYIVLVPLLLVGLTYGALRNAVLIRQLKARPHA